MFSPVSAAAPTFNENVGNMKFNFNVAAFQIEHLPLHICVHLASCIVLCTYLHRLMVLG